MGVFSEIVCSCAYCGGRAVCQGPEDLIGHGKIDLDDQRTVQKLPRDMQVLLADVLRDADDYRFDCGHCGRCFSWADKRDRETPPGDSPIAQIYHP